MDNTFKGVKCYCLSEEKFYEILKEYVEKNKRIAAGFDKQFDMFWIKLL